MNKKEMLAFAKEAAKNMKTEKDLSDFSRMLIILVHLKPQPIKQERSFGKSRLLRLVKCTARQEL